MPCGYESTLWNVSFAPFFSPATCAGLFACSRKVVTNATCVPAIGRPTRTRGVLATCTWTRWPGWSAARRTEEQVTPRRHRRYSVSLFHLRFQTITALLVV